MTATAVQTKTGGWSTPRPASYVGPLWAFPTADGGAVCGRDDRSGRLVCTCKTYARTGRRCRHVANVILNHRRDAAYRLPDTTAEAVTVTFEWITRLLAPNQPTQHLTGMTITLRRMGT